MVTKDVEQQLNLLCEQIHYTIPSVELFRTWVYFRSE